jgi:Na+/citrate or Na+/malate symporter
MPTRWYFIIGDLLSGIIVGMAAALCCHQLIDSQWSMLPAMIVAMVIGMVVSMVLALLLLMRFFGAMEVMIPTMLGGMYAGMVVGMRASMSELAIVDACLYGALTGLVTVILCWLVNYRLQGEVNHD